MEQLWKALANLPRATTRTAGDPRLPPCETRNGVWKREIYDLVRSYKRTGDLRIIIKVVDNLDTEPAVPFDVNPYLWALHAATDGKNEEIGLKKQEKALFADELLYADRHHIPPELLIGFLYQLGSHQQMIKKWNKVDSFERWNEELKARLTDREKSRSLRQPPRPKPNKKR